jgi:hypothetical protein
VRRAIAGHRYPIRSCWILGVTVDVRKLRLHLVISAQSAARSGKHALALAVDAVEVLVDRGYHAGVVSCASGRRVDVIELHEPDVTQDMTRTSTLVPRGSMNVRQATVVDPDDPSSRRERGTDCHDWRSRVSTRRRCRVAGWLASSASVGSAAPGRDWSRRSTESWLMSRGVRSRSASGRRTACGQDLSNLVVRRPPIVGLCERCPSEDVRGSGHRCPAPVTVLPPWRPAPLSATNR